MGQFADVAHDHVLDRTCRGTADDHQALQDFHSGHTRAALDQIKDGLAKKRDAMRTGESALRTPAVPDPEATFDPTEITQGSANKINDQAT